MTTMETVAVEQGRARVSQSDVRQALAQVAPAIAKKSSLPVLANVLLQLITRDGIASADLAPETSQILRISGTNLEISIVTEIPCPPSLDACDGALTVPAADLQAWIGTLTNAPVDIAIDHQTANITLTCERSKATFKGIEADEYPTLPSMSAEHLITFDVRAADLIRLIDRTVYAAATDMTRPVLSAVALYLTGTRLDAVTTDGFRLGEHTITLDKPARDAGSTQPVEPLEILMPATSLTRASALIAGHDTVTVGVLRGSDGKPSQAFIRAGSTVLMTRLIEGRFPDYKRIIPATPPKIAATIDRRDALRLTKQAAIFAKPSSNILKLTATPGIDAPGSVGLRATAAEMGAGSAELDATTVGDLSGLSAINVKYFAEMLDSLESDRVTIEFRDPSHALVVRPVGDEQTRCVIMPMTIRD